MSLYNTFKTDAVREAEGFPIEYDDFRVTIARAGGANKAYAKVLEARTKPYRRAIALEIMDNDRSLEILREVYSETIVKDWETKVDGKWKKGIEAEGETKLLPVTAKNILLTLNNLPDVFLDLKDAAEKLTLWRADLRETEAENS